MYVWPLIPWGATYVCRLVLDVCVAIDPIGSYVCRLVLDVCVAIDPTGSYVG